MTLIHPTVHLNGTSKDGCSRATWTLAALVTTPRALCVRSNGRDYYPQAPGAFTEAMRPGQPRHRPR